MHEKRLLVLLRHAHRAVLQHLLAAVLGDADHERLKQIVGHGVRLRAVLCHADAAVLELVLAVRLRVAHVAGVLAVQPAVVHHDVLVHGIVLANRVDGEARIGGVRPALRLGAEAVVAAPLHHLPVPERVAALEAENRHPTRAVVLVEAVVALELPVRAARVDPVARVVLLRRHERGDHVHGGDVARDPLLGQRETEAAVRHRRQRHGLRPRGPVLQVERST